MRFIIEDLAGIDEIATLPGYEDVTSDVTAAILDEAGRLASEVLAPLDRVGDVQGSRLVDGNVSTPAGWQ